jgi:hypothetical protein
MIKSNQRDMLLVTSGNYLKFCWQERSSSIVGTSFYDLFAPYRLHI